MIYKVSAFCAVSSMCVISLLESAICREKNVKISQNFLTACMTASTEEAHGVSKGVLCFRTSRGNK